MEGTWITENGKMFYLYRLVIPTSYAEAIQWHGGRYETTDLLCRKMVQNDDGNYTISLYEHEACELKEAWEAEDYCFACGSREMTSWFNDFLETIV